MSNINEQKKVKITIGDTSLGRVQNFYIEDFQNVEEGRMKFNTIVDLGHTILGYCKYLYETNLSDVEEYERIKESALYNSIELFEYNVPKKKYRVYKITLEKEYDTTDIEIEFFRRELNNLPNKIIKEVEKEQY